MFVFVRMCVFASVCALAPCVDTVMDDENEQINTKGPVIAATSQFTSACLHCQSAARQRRRKERRGTNDEAVEELWRSYRGVDGEQEREGANEEERGADGPGEIDREGEGGQYAGRD